MRGNYKSRDEAIRLKTLGNDCFKKHANFKALEFYTKAMLLAPYSSEDQRQFLASSLDLLKCSSSSKYEVAASLHVHPTSTETATPTAEKDPLLSQCFGNKSAVLYEMNKYKECQFNIEQALVLGFPPGSAHKLQSRKEKCRAAQLEVKGDQLGSDSNGTVTRSTSMSAFQSDFISVSSSPDLGRHMIAAKDIHRGAVILSEDPYASILDPGFLTTHCSLCFKKSPFSLLPCILCACETYCSMECRQEAWVRYHWMECKSPNHWRKNADWMEVLCLRIVLSANPMEVWNACRGMDLQGDYGRVYSLLPHEGKFSDDNQQALLAKAAKNLIQHFGKSILKYMLPSSDYVTVSRTSEENNEQSELILLEGLFLRHLLQLRCNSHAISEVLSELEYDSEHSNASDRSVEAVREMRIGTVLLPTASLMNHSCSPNAIFRFVGSKVLVCVTRDLEKGDEINNSYGPQIGRMKTAWRKRELREKYFFDCQCAACNGSDAGLVFAEAAMSGLCCQNCSTGALTELEAGEEDTNYICCHCQAKLSRRDLYKQIEMKKKGETLFESAISGEKGIADDLEQLLECHEMQTSVLHKYNLALARTKDTIAQVYARQGNFVLSCKFLELSCCSVSAIYGEQSIEFANEMRKMASTLFHSGEMRQALEAAKKAKRILAIYLGPNHSDSRDLDEMIKLFN